MSGGGKPGCAFGPHGGGENQSVSAGPSPLHETRTKNRRSTTDWKLRIDLTRIGMEHASCEVLPLIFHLVLCTILVLADSLHRIDHPRCVSAKNACIFYRTLTQPWQTAPLDFAIGFPGTSEKFCTPER